MAYNIAQGQHEEPPRGGVPVDFPEATAYPGTHFAQQAIVPDVGRGFNQPVSGIPMQQGRDIETGMVNSSLVYSNHNANSAPYAGGPGTNLKPVDHMRKAKNSSMDVCGSSVSFKDVNYTVKVKDPETKQIVDRQILKGCTGNMKIGTLNAIMGASGGGKTSLLDVLADRKEGGGLSGSIYVDGLPRDAETFKHNSGYVVQDDVVMGTLTVRENLMFSAELRLPGTISKAEKARRVNDVIDELGLSKVADSKVGNEFIRGVSGGERKRVNIGMELITSPSVLFLDEPTSGLDATTSSSVLALLRRLADQGRTIILSIHQPRFKIFQMFDSVTLLSNGSFVYHGPTANVIPYFASVGFVCGEFNNPADFVLDVINGGETPKGELIAPCDMEDIQERKAKIAEVQGRLVASYANSELSRNAVNEVNIELSHGHGHTRRDIDYNGTYAVSWVTQVGVTSVRAFKNVIRNPATSIGQVFVNIIIGVITGCIFYRLDEQTDIQKIIRDRTGALFFISINLMFSNMSALEVLLKERAIFMHEKASGYYRVSSYFMSKLLCDMFPVRILPTAVFSVVVYFMAGFQRTPEKFFWFLLIAELQSMCAASVCLLCSSLISVFAVANLACTMFYVIMMIFSGLLVSINSWPDSSRWLGYLSFTKYSYELFVENEFDGLVLPCKATGEPCLGVEVLSDKYLDIPELGEKWKKIVALAVYTFGLMFLSYLALLRLKKRS